MTPVNIVVSRWEKNVDFAYKINGGKDINVLVYDKENPANPYNVPVNKGNEASVFLKYIVDFYDTLSEFTFFIHDEDYSWHHSGSINEKFQEAVKTMKKFYNVNDRMVWTQPIPDWEFHNLMCFYNDFVGPYIPFDTLPNKDNFILGYRGSAQFLVHKDVILNLPKKFYERLYNWITTTTERTSSTGRWLEYTWHVYFDIFPRMSGNCMDVLEPAVVLVGDVLEASVSQCDCRVNCGLDSCVKEQEPTKEPQQLTEELLEEPVKEPVKEPVLNTEVHRELHENKCNIQ